MVRWPEKAEPIFDGGSVGVPLTRGMYAWVDLADWPAVAKHRWCAQKGHGTWYAIRARQAGETGPRTPRMHSELTGWPRVDHADGDGLNNRRANLREASRSQNSANSRPYARRSSFFKGLRQERNGNWTARVQRRHIGTFPTEEAAARAYDIAARLAFGEFARLNFPEER